MKKQLIIESVTGFDELEKKCMDGIVIALKAWIKMERQHPDEMRDFFDSIHRIQDLLAVRVGRRNFPIGWSACKERPPATPKSSRGSKRINP